jgi:hypothetical protein
MKAAKILKQKKKRKRNNFKKEKIVDNYKNIGPTSQKKLCVVVVVMQNAHTI